MVYVYICICQSKKQQEYKQSMTSNKVFNIIKKKRDKLPVRMEEDGCDEMEDGGVEVGVFSYTGMVYKLAATQALTITE
jgi:hypothetical protein